jgi:hypothetical protein
MDNKKDKQFYWEVKDFLTKKPNLNVKPKTESVVNTVKSLLETSKPKPAPTVSYNENMTSAVKKAINKSQEIKNNGTPSIVAFTKNIAGNPFRSLTESVKKIYEQDEEKFNQDTLQTSARELADIQTQLRDIDPNNATPEQRKQYVSLRDQEAAAQATRDKQLELQKQDEEETEEAEAQVAGSTIKTTSTGARVGVKPDFVKEREAQAAQATPATAGVDTEGPAVPTADEEREAAARAQKEKEAADAAKATEKKEPTEDEKFSSARTDYYKKQNAKKKLEAEQRLAAIKQLDTSKMSQSGRMAVARNEMKFQQQLRGDMDMSDSDIAKRVSGDLKYRNDTQAKQKEKINLPPELARPASGQSYQEWDKKRNEFIAAERSKRGLPQVSASEAASRAAGKTPSTKPGSMSNLGASPEAIAAANQQQSGKFAGTSGSTPKPTGTSTTASTPPTTSTSSTQTGSQVSQKTNNLFGGTQQKPTGSFEQAASKPASLSGFVPSSENDNLEPGFRELNQMNPQASFSSIKTAQPIKQTKASSYRI